MDPTLFTPEKITIIAILMGVIFTGFKKMWVWGYQLKEAEDRATRWEGIAMRALQVTEKVVEKAPNVP